MNVNMTKAEYEILLDVLHIADWVLHAHKIEEDPRTEKYRELGQKFFSLAQEMGCETLIRFDPKSEKYLPTAAYEDQAEVMEFIEEYDEDTFWDELGHRLAFRDLVREEGEENVDGMPWQERAERVESLCDDYMEEFSENGLDRVTIES